MTESKTIHINLKNFYDNKHTRSLLWIFKIYMVILSFLENCWVPKGIKTIKQTIQSSLPVRYWFRFLSDGNADINGLRWHTPHLEMAY